MIYPDVRWSWPARLVLGGSAVGLIVAFAWALAASL